MEASPTETAYKASVPSPGQKNPERSLAASFVTKPLSWNRTAKGYVVRCSKLADREQAEFAKGKGIWTSEQNLPAPDDDDFYWKDLLQCEVYSTDRRELGVVADIIETGANDVLLVKRGTQELLIPFAASYVLKVNVEDREIVVDWSEDW